MAQGMKPPQFVLHSLVGGKQHGQFDVGVQFTLNVFGLGHVVDGLAPGFFHPTQFCGGHGPILFVQRPPLVETVGMQKPPVSTRGPTAQTTSVQHADVLVLRWGFIGGQMVRDGGAGHPTANDDHVHDIGGQGGGRLVIPYVLKVSGEIGEPVRCGRSGFREGQRERHLFRGGREDTGLNIPRGQVVDRRTGSVFLI